MNTVIEILAWPFALAPFIAPPVVVVVMLVPRWRRRVLRPLTRRRTARRNRAAVARHAVMEARTAELEAAVEVANLPKWTIE